MSKLLRHGSSRFLWISEVIYFRKIWEYFAGRNEKFTTKCSYFTVQKNFLYSIHVFLWLISGTRNFLHYFSLPSVSPDWTFQHSNKLFLFNTRFLLGINFFLFFLLTGRYLNFYLSKLICHRYPNIEKFQKKCWSLEWVSLEKIFPALFSDIFFCFFTTISQCTKSNRILKLIFLVECV